MMKKATKLIFGVGLAILLGVGQAFAQNGIIGSGFEANDWSTTYSFSDGAGGTRKAELTANGTGNQYFRLVTNWDSNYNHWGPSSTENDLLVTDGVVVSSSDVVENNSAKAYYINVSSISDKYIFKTRSGGNPPGNPSFLVLKVEGDVRTISSVSEGSAAVGTPITITATLDDAFNTGQGAYLRYSTDGFTTSTVVEMTGSGTTYTAEIAGQTSGTTVTYYTFTSGSGLTVSPADADFYTINLNNNGGSNYSIDVDPITADTDGNWSTPGTWNTGEVPESGSTVVIDANVTLDADQEVDNITINSGSALSSSSNTLTVGGNFTNNGTFNAETGKILFTGDNTVSGTVSFNNVDASGGVNFGTTSTLTGEFRILSGGYANTNPPIYGSGSTLVYETGGTYGAGVEWPTAEADAPKNVKIVDSDVNFGGSTDGRFINESLTIESGGSLALSTNVGGDLKLKGNWSNAGSFTANSRAVFFVGSGNQEVINTSGSTLIEIPYVIIDKDNASDEIRLNADMVIASSLQLDKGTLVTNNRLTLNSGASYSNSGTVTGNITFQREITGDAGWRMLSLPKTGGTVADISDDTAIQGVTGGDNTEHDSNFYYNPKAGTGASNGWTVPTNTTTPWGDGLGFITYFFDNTDAGSSELPIILDATGNEPSGDVTVSIDSTFTLLGNPYASNIAIDDISGDGIAVALETILQGGLKSPISVWNDSLGTFSTFNFGNDDVISAWQGFFVERDEDVLTVATKATNITIPESAKTTDAADSTVFSKLGTPSSRKIDFSLSGEGFNDLSNKLYFTSLSNEGKDPFDGTKLAGLNNAPYIAFIQNFGNGSEYLVQDARALSIEEKQVYQLGFNDMGVSGEFTLSWPNWENIPEDWDFVLSDHNTGYSIDMRDESSYSFTSESRQKRPVTTSLLPPNIKAKSSGIAPRFTITLTANNVASSNEIKELPSVFALEQNYPNPFNPTTTVKYSVAKAGEVQLSVYNMMGQKVADLVNGTKQAGSYAISWNAEGMASGMYFYRLSAAGQTMTRQMTLIK